MTEKLNPTQFSAAANIADWRVQDGSATARFNTGSFATGVELVGAIGALADAANHHPDVELHYPYVAVTLTTHDAGSCLTELDVALAQQISDAARSLGIDAEPVPVAIHADHVQMLSSRQMGVLATITRAGRPQLSTINYAYEAGEVRISVTDGRAKVKNLRRDPRATLHVPSPDGWSWMAAEGIVEFGPVAAATDDAAADELVEVYRAIGGEHPDWAEFRAAMVAEKRLVLHMTVTRTYGHAR